MSDKPTDKDILSALDNQLNIQMERQKVTDVNFQKLTSVMERLIKHMDQQEIRNASMTMMEKKLKASEDKHDKLSDKVIVLEVDSKRVNKIMSFIMLTVVGIVISRVIEMSMIKGV
jgi:CII-binding regulator of phage lambda lysogenization HflD